MVNGEKVLRMTKMASYEAGGGKRDKAVAGYFMGDYIGMQLIVSFLVVTCGFAAVFAAYLFLNFEEVMAEIYTMDLLGVGRQLLLVYLIAVLFYLAVTYAVYLVRYRSARRRLNVFMEYLNSLEDPEEEEF